jgi:hypothetical protein
MGYQVHITRAKHWAENEGLEIPASEWHDLVKCDPELRLAAANGPHFAIWNASAGQIIGWLDWNNGNITTKSPDEQLLAKMIEIAERLGARVQGDDGEMYGVTPTTATWRASLLGNTPLLSLILSLVALVVLAVALPINAMVHRQYPIDTPIPLWWAVTLAALTLVGGLCWLIAGVLATKSLAARQSPRHLAVAALVVDVLAVCVAKLIR